jgi:hypothetical protein
MNRVKGMFIVVGSLFVTSAIGFTGFRIFRGSIADKMVHSKYEIQSIIQTGPEKEALPTIYLAELLNLSRDLPQNYFTFDEKKAEKRLLTSPVIEKAIVKKIKPNTIYIDYEVFRPIALWGDNSNLAIDEKGHVFPIEPYFSPKRLPEIYFGKQEIEREKLEIALAILIYFDKRSTFEETIIKMIDVSEALHESFGKREVVITLEEKGQTWYLRLTPHKFPEELNNFITLKRSYMTSSKGKKVVDLRLAKVAYVEEVLN